jgi:hypothetical protein
MVLLSDADRLELKKLARTGSEARNALAPLVAGATDPDESRRQSAVGHLLQTWPPGLLVLLARRLAEVLVRDRVPVRRRAAASLVQLGAPAVPALLVVFLTTGRTVDQRQAVELLGEIGLNLNQEGRGELIEALDKLLAEALDSSIRQRLMHVMARLSMKCIRVRIARERAQRTGTDNGQGPAEDQEWPRGATDGRLVEQAGLLATEGHPAAAWPLARVCVSRPIFGGVDSGQRPCRMRAASVLPGQRQAVPSTP